MKVRQEEDLVPGRTIMIVLVGVVVATVIGVLIAWWITADRGTAPSDAPILETFRQDREEVNEIELTLFDGPAPASAVERAQRERLESYGWVDQQEEVVHIPIERAMQIYQQTVEQPSRPPPPPPREVPGAEPEAAPRGTP